MGALCVYLKRFLKYQLPLLHSEGFKTPCHEGIDPPSEKTIWLLNYSEFINTYKKGFLDLRQLIIPEAELLNQELRKNMAISITSEDWEMLMKLQPSFEKRILQIYKDLSLKVFTQASFSNAFFRIKSLSIVRTS